MPEQLTQKERKLLHGAATGNLGLVGSLLKPAARVCDLALVTAASHGHLSIVNKLLSADVKPVALDEAGYTALLKAAQNGHEAVVDRLLAAGASVNIANTIGESALTLASANGYDAIVCKLLAAGADPNHTNKRGTTALMGAAMYGHARVTEMLLMAGANANAMNEDTTSALATAASNGFLEIVEKLIVFGARVDHADAVGETPLIGAATFGHVEVVKALLSAGANVNAVNIKNETALIMAAGSGHVAVCHVLVCNAATQAIHANDGDTAVQRASKKGHTDVVTLLQGCISPHQNLVSVSTTQTVLFVSDPKLFPYHAAVQASGGDVAHFQELVSTVKLGKIDSDAPMQMRIVTNTATCEAICAAQFAYLLGYHSVGDAISARMTTAMFLAKEPASYVSPQEDITRFPFILAVAETTGNVQQCMDCIDAIDSTKHALEEQVQANIEREQSQFVSWSVLQYACQLGYVDIVKELFNTICSDASSVTRIQAIKCSWDRANARKI